MSPAPTPPTPNSLTRQNPGSYNRLEIEAPILTIREAQIDVFRDVLRQDFILTTVARIKANFPESYRRLGDQGATLFVENTIEKASRHNVYTAGAVVALIELMLDFGEDFERSPDRQWAKCMLQHPTLPEDVKLAAMRERMTALTQGRRIIQA